MSVKVIIPQIGQSIAEATIVKWFKKPGESVQKGEILLEIGTDKINTEIPAPESGVIERLLAQEGETLPVLSEVAVIAGETLEVHDADGSPAVHNAGGTPIVQGESRGYSPVVRKLAQEHNIDLSEVRGTGEGGRITRQDVEKWIDSRAPTSAEPANKSEIQPMSRMRRLIAEHMLQSKRSTAELTTVFEIDMSEVARQRQQASELYQKNYGIKITYLSFVVSAVAKALRAHPIVNSSIEGENIRFHSECNIGIATAVEEGLLVPVIRNADTKNVAEIARAIADFGEKARTKRLSPDDLAGGTFTITNPGVFGALLGTPIISYPQVAILGVGAVEKRPVVINDAIAIRSMAYFSLTYDHRAMDGSGADSFMANIKKTLETQCPSALD